jgi:L-fuconolactonase
LVDEWKNDFEKFKIYKNVYCKMAGLVTETHRSGWKDIDFKPYINIVFDFFGTGRIMFGSDWPVCLTSPSYKQVCKVVENNTSFLSDEEKKKL